MKKNLIFIGMPAVGKSTVGIVVAKRLGMKFIDADLLIQEQEKKLFREIIAGCWTRWLSENRKSGKCRTVRQKILLSHPGGSVIYCRDAMRAL